LRCDSDLDADVAIVGAGPAGSAAALALGRHTRLRVALLERSTFAEPRTGEYVTTSVGPLLEYLGVDGDLLAQDLPAHGTLSAWGSAELARSAFPFWRGGRGWRVDRRRFDAALAGEAVRRGAVLVDGAVVHEVAYDAVARRWEVGFERASARRVCRARYVIDAGGPAAHVARRLGARFVSDDGLYAAVARYEGAGSELSSLVLESAPDGWWYALEIPGDVFVVSFLTDAEGIRRLRSADASGWDALLARTVHIGRLVRGRSPATLDVRFVPSRRTSPAAGAGWVAAGDAALASDPLASLGIGFAVTSGAHAARVLHLVANGEEDAVRRYDRAVAAAFEQYRTLRARFYACERRWAERPFWVQRASAAARRW
jgi:flavin-dependent dehydrogenase